MIKVLDQQTANSIAAGEVVERPASVVKELVENSLDAGASSVSCEIEAGGIKRIKITDNGCGMSPNDAQICFDRHATSKLTKIEDLNDLHSMGFRGEALASIAAVAKLRLETRQIGVDQGYFVEIAGGQLKGQGELGCAEGTSLEIKDLFYNTPARYKFLKKDSTEAGYIQDLLVRLALSRPDVSFKFIKDGNVVLHTPGNNDLLSTIYVCLGKQIADKSVPLSCQFNTIDLSGYISLPEVARGNRSRYIFIVNGRCVQSATMQAAVDEAIKTWYMRGKFPAVVLNLQVPLHLVDVNIHPQKLQVKFWDNQEVFRAVYHGIREAFEQGAQVAAGQQALPDQPKPSTSKTDSSKPIKQANFLDQLSSGQNFQLRQDHVEPRRPASSSRPIVDPHPVNQVEEKERPAYSPLQSLEERGPAYELGGKPIPATVKSPETTAVTGQEQASPVKIPLLEGARYAGQIFNTFIIFEQDDKAIFIDQHAAHERILYEQFIRQRDSADQTIPQRDLLVADTLDLSLAEMACLEQHREIFEQQGYSFDFFGDQTVVIRSVPAYDQDKFAYREDFRNLLDLAVDHKLDKVDLTDEVYHMRACKAAVKAHDRLTIQEIEALVKDLQKLKNPYHCPHGRPTYIVLKRTDFDKLFKRIV